MFDWLFNRNKKDKESNPEEVHNKEERFWNWFSKNAERYYYGLEEQKFDELFPELTRHLQSYHEDLVFEFSPIWPDKTREFVISADGIKEAFPAVEALVSAAPDIPNWTIVAFRQARPESIDLTIGDFTLTQENVGFRYAINNRKVDLELFIKGFGEEASEEKFQQAMFIMLDSLLGEYDVEMYIGYIDMEAWPDNSDDLIPIIKLHDILNEHRTALSN